MPTEMVCDLQLHRKQLGRQIQKPHTWGFLVGRHGAGRWSRCCWWWWHQHPTRATLTACHLSFCWWRRAGVCPLQNPTNRTTRLLRIPDVGWNKDFVLTLWNDTGRLLNFFLILKSGKKWDGYLEAGMAAKVQQGFDHLQVALIDGYM